VTTLEQQLLSDTTVFDSVELPRAFRAELGKTLRHLPPPAPPARKGVLLKPSFRLALAAAAAIALLLYVGSRSGDDSQQVAGEDGSAEPQVENVQPNAPSAPEHHLVMAESGGLPGVTAASVYGAGGDPRSEFVDAKLEQEWIYIKADAKALSGPFRSAMPSALYRLD